MKEFNLTAEKIKSNGDKFFQIIDKLFFEAQGNIPSRSKQLRKMYLDFGDRLYLAPASCYTHFHNAIPGGYVDHVLRVMSICPKVYELWKLQGMDVSNFTVNELMFAALNHDLGKLGFPKDHLDHYVPETSEWHLKRGRKYVGNPQIPWAEITDRGLFVLQRYGIPCTWNEYLGIKIHDGMYDSANEDYYTGFSEEKKMRCNLPFILHQADMIASRFEFERWNNSSNSINMNRLEFPDIELSQSTTNSTKPTESLVDEFDKHF